MRIWLMFRRLTALTAVLTFSTPFVTLAQQNSVQREAENAAAQDVYAVRLEAKTAAERDASSDINKPLWFCMGICIPCIGVPIGAISGSIASSMINQPEQVGEFIGPVVGILVPFMMTYHYQSHPPSKRLIGKSPEYVIFYTNAYRKRAQSLRIKSTAIGAATGFGLGVVIYFRTK